MSMLHLETVSIPSSTANTLNDDQVGDEKNRVTLRLLRSTTSVDGDDSHVILFLPFWGGSHSTFEKLILHLAASKSSAVYISMSYAGTGGTPIPADDDDAEVHSIVPRARQVLQLLLSPEYRSHFVSKRLILCAHSMSAKVAYVLLSMLAQEHLSLNVEALLLLAPAPIEPLHLPADIREQQLHAYDTFDSAAWTVKNVLSSRPLDQTALRDLANDCVEMSPGAKQGWLRHGMIFDCAADLENVAKRWPHMALKVVMGEHDGVETVDRVLHQTVRPLKDAEFRVDTKVVRGCGHLLPVEAVDEVAQSILELL